MIFSATETHKCELSIWLLHSNVYVPVYKSKLKCLVGEKRKAMRTPQFACVCIAQRSLTCVRSIHSAIHTWLRTIWCPKLSDECSPKRQKLKINVAFFTLISFVFLLWFMEIVEGSSYFIKKIWEFNSGSKELFCYIFFHFHYAVVRTHNDTSTKQKCTCEWMMTLFLCVQRFIFLSLYLYHGSFWLSHELVACSYSLFKIHQN